MGPDVLEKEMISCPCQDSNPLLFYHLNTRNRDSSVSIVTGIWAGRSGVRGAYSSILQNGLRVSFAPWMKGPGRDVDISPPSSVKVKNEWSCTSLSPIRLHGVDKGNHLLSLKHTLISCFRRHFKQKLFTLVLSWEIGIIGLQMICCSSLPGFLCKQALWLMSTSSLIRTDELYKYYVKRSN